MIEAATLAIVNDQVAKLQRLVGAFPIQAIEHIGVVVYIAFTHPRHGTTYVVRFRCDGYPLTPASVHFVDPVSHEDTGPHVWATDGEQAIKTQANPRFICLPGTREYHQHHGGPIPGVHSLTLAAIFTDIFLAVQARG